MTTDSKVLWGAIALVLLALVAFLLSGKVEEQIAPEPRRAWVAILPAGAEVAVVGPVELASEKAFTLFAVLEAESWRGEPIFYTEAPGLRLGEVEVAESSLRKWNRPEETRILWFSVEGMTPYLRVEDPTAIEEFEFKEFFRPEWPRTWSIPGEIMPISESLLPDRPRAGLSPFGTQRFHVRIEIFGPESSITPRRRLMSWGGEELPERLGAFPAVTVELPGLLAAPSRVFGLTQIDPSPAALPTMGELLLQWHRQGIAFTRATVLRDMLDSAGLAYDKLEWNPVDLEEGPPWGAAGATAGDLVRAGERLVVLLEDRERAGVLDGTDLCIDFFRGAAVRRLDEVFIGAGVVEWASLAR